MNLYELPTDLHPDTMDFLNLFIGFLIGIVTSTLAITHTALGNFLGDRLTDARREQIQAAKMDKDWQELEARFPALLQEMREDFSTSTGQNVRTFIITDSDDEITDFPREPSFQYYKDKHDNLFPAVYMLQQLSYVSEISTSRTPKFRVHERLVDRLLKGKM